MSAMLPQPSQAMLPQPNQQLAKNPMLPGLPETGNMDAQYLAEEAQLRAQIAKQYADILQQLGWVDEQGNFLPGSISVNASRQIADLQYQSGLAEKGVTEATQREGTLFSGKRAERTAEAQQPMQRGIAQIGVDTPLKLGQQYENAAGLIDQYTLQNNLMLAQMAARQAALISKNPAGAPGQQGGGGGGPDDGGGGYDDQSPGTGLTGDDPGEIAAGAGYPFLNPSAPDQVYTPINAGNSWSAEPKPTSANIYQGPYNQQPVPPPGPKRRPGTSSQGFRGIL